MIAGPMDPEFWHERWAAARIGFHEGQPNCYLARHAERLANHPRVLVPLCGKSEDLAYLASRGHEVIGVELVEDAVRAFFDEHGLSPTVTKKGKLVEYASSPITIYAGDILEATREVIGGAVDAIYDRAALVALPDESRRRYVDHIRSLASRAARVLIVTFEYDQALMEGPPFAIEEAELRMLYDGTQEIELLSEGAAEMKRDNPPPIMERCFAITL